MEQLARTKALEPVLQLEPELESEPEPELESEPEPELASEPEPEAVTTAAAPEPDEG